jgi:hypothetical protein
MRAYGFIEHWIIKQLGYNKPEGPIMIIYDIT